MYAIRFILLILLLGTYKPCHAQRDLTERRLYKAQKLYKAKKYEKQIQYLIRSLSYGVRKEPIYAALAEVELQLHQYARAAEHYRLAMNDNPRTGTRYHLPLAQSLLLMGKPDAARVLLYQLQPKSDWPPDRQQLYDKLMASVILYKQIMLSTPDSIALLPLGPRVNTHEMEYLPSISRNDSTLIFTTRVNGMEEDFWYTTRDACDGAWLLARPFGTPPNSSQNEGAQSLSADGHYLFFMRCGNTSQNGWAGGGCDLYFSYTIPGGWAAPETLGATINTPSYEGMPSINSANDALYFVSNRPGGYGGMDIYVSHFKDGVWQIPQNLGPEINTAGDELSPSIAADGTTLYFSSNGWPGIGGSDFFVAKRKADGQWQKAQNMGLPYNSPADEMGIAVQLDGTKIYMSSNRNGGAGAMDLYEVPLATRLRPERVVFVAGTMHDAADSSAITNATLSFYYQGRLQQSVLTNKGDGSYFAVLPHAGKYTVVAQRYDYPEREYELEVAAPSIHPPTLLDLYQYRYDAVLPSD